jgi:predicted O-methyltransferase YrrM
VRRLFFRQRAAREVAALVMWLRRRRELPDIAHMTIRNEVPDGPVQRDEVLFLHGLIRVTRPRTVVEVGFLRGHSALNFLLALDEDAKLYSFDIDPGCERYARDMFGHDDRFVFQRIPQEQLTPEAVDGRPIDFLFLDAAHELELNRATFERLRPALADDALIALHDTGTFHRRLIPDGHAALAETDRWAGDEFEAQPGERAFLNWLLEAHPEFAQVHFHSHRVPRCGITVVQRARRLARPGEPVRLAPSAADTS